MRATGCRTRELLGETSNVLDIPQGYSHAGFAMAVIIVQKNSNKRFRKLASNCHQHRAK